MARSKARPPGLLSPLFFKGAVDTLPLIIAATPFAILFGALSLEYGLSFFAAIGMSAIVFAGASQFVAIGLIGAGAPIAIIIITVFVVNLRHMLYSISFMPRIKSLPKWQRVPMAFWMTDESFAVVSHYLNKEPSDKELHQYFWGSAMAMYVNWVLFTFIGVSLGQVIPDMTQWGLDIAMVLAFIAIFIPSIKNNAHFACFLVAVVAAIITYDWPYKTGLLISSLLGITVGVFIERKYPVKPKSIKDEH